MKLVFTVLALLLVIATVLMWVGWYTSAAKLTPTQERALNLTGGGPVGPQTREALELAEALNDLRQAGDIKSATIASRIGCATAIKNAFDPETAQSRYKVYHWASGRIECFQSGKYHPMTGEPLLPMSRADVETIRGNSGLYPPDANGLYDLNPPSASRPRAHPSASAAPAERPSTSALPALGEGPCCP